jgi:hypothetical protein
LADAKLAQACCGTIRLKLFKIGAVIVRNARRVHLMLSGACPDQNFFQASGKPAQTGKKTTPKKAKIVQRSAPLFADIGEVTAQCRDFGTSRENDG